MAAKTLKFLLMLFCMAVVQPVFAEAVYPLDPVEHQEVNIQKQKKQHLGKWRKKQPKKIKQQQANYFLITVLFSLLMVVLIVLGVVLAITALWIIGVVLLSLIVLVLGFIFIMLISSGPWE